MEQATSDLIPSSKLLDSCRSSQWFLEIGAHGEENHKAYVVNFYKEKHVHCASLEQHSATGFVTLYDPLVGEDVIEVCQKLLVKHGIDMTLVAEFEQILFQWRS